MLRRGNAYRLIPQVARSARQRRSICAKNLYMTKTVSFPKDVSDAELEKHLADASCPSLLPALAYITGDYTILKPHLRPDPALVGMPQGGLTDEQQAEIRSIALDVLKKFRDSGANVELSRSDEDMRKAMEWASGTSMDADYLPLLKEELSVTGDDLRAPKWNLKDIAPGRSFKVLIIGAGMSGILAAHRLRQAGVEVELVDKNADVGGTWLENVYPGCRVDVANHMYSYSFEQRNDWPGYYSAQATLLDYFRNCADKFGIRPLINFNTEVHRSVYDEKSGKWTVETTSNGQKKNFEADAVISAVGQLNRPNMPDIVGMDKFKGESWHTARYRTDVSIKGKRVAVIGSAASAVQLMPTVAKEAAHVDLYQRTPNWFFGVPEYHAPVDAGLQWLFGNIPGYAQWYRFWLFWRGSEGMLPACQVDPNWKDQTLSVSQANQDLRALMEDYLKEQFGDRPDLLEKVIPQYPPASKRIVVDNGIWATTLKRDNVSLVTDRIGSIEETGIRDVEGVLREVDIIIYATGFQPSKFLMPMEVVGLNGVELQREWKGDARAFMGVTVPKFPNFFILYGPNTNIVVNGSIIYFTECEVTYVMRYIEHLLRNNLKALDVKQDVHQAYNDRVDKGNAGMVWGVATVNSWYRNEYNRVAQNWPFSLLEYWQQVQEIKPEQYDALT